jgi:hypothetical protein
MKTGHGNYLGFNERAEIDYFNTDVAASAIGVEPYSIEKMLKVMEEFKTGRPCYLVLGPPNPHLEISIPMRPPEYLSPSNVRYSLPLTMPVVRSPYVLGFAEGASPPRILEDFDGWFKQALWRIEWDKKRAREEAEERRAASFDNCWRE